MLYLHTICHQMSFTCLKVGNTWILNTPLTNTVLFKSRLRSGEIQTWEAGKTVLIARKVLSVSAGEEGLLEMASVFQNTILEAISALPFNLMWYWGE